MPCTHSRLLTFFVHGLLLLHHPGLQVVACLIPTHTHTHTHTRALTHTYTHVRAQAAAIGVMYLSTMAGALEASELAMYSALLMDSDNSEMIEFLMAGMWILLRSAENRKVGACRASQGTDGSRSAGTWGIQGSLLLGLGLVCLS